MERSTDTLDEKEYFSRFEGKALFVKSWKIELVDFVGAGGAGCVYKGKWQGKDVAVKILDPRAKDNARSRFRQEAKTTETLRHKNITQCYLHGTTKIENEVLDFLVMEYIDGESLDKIIKQSHSPLELSEVSRIIKETGLALSYAHEHLCIHRDVKPANIIRDKKGTVKLTDFGIAKVSNQDMEMTKTAEGLAMGTPYYMSPEQARNSKDVKASSDLYSLGATFYEMITNKWPFDGDSAFTIIEKITKEEPPAIRQLNPKVSELLEDLILRAMAKVPKQRQRSVDEFLSDLATIEEQKLDVAAIDDVRQQWEKENKLTPAADFLFEALKIGTVDLSNETAFEPAKLEIVKECLKIERKRLIEFLKRVSDKISTDTNTELVRTYERLLEITPRTEKIEEEKETVLLRIEWLKKAERVYKILGHPEKKESMENKLAWEENRLKYLAEKNPGLKEKLLPPKSFLERHGRKLRLSAAVLAGLGLISSASYIGGGFVKDYLARKDLDAAITQQEKDIHARIENCQFNALEEDIGKLKNLYIKKDGEAGPADDLDRLFKAKKEENRLKNLYSEVKEKINAAYEALAASKKDGLSSEEKNALLKKASDLNMVIEKIADSLVSQRADELKREAGRLSESIGPQRFAFKKFDEIQNEYGQVEQEYASLENRLDKDEFFSREIVKTVKEKINLYKLVLSGIQSYFIDGNFKKVASFSALEDKISSIESNLSQLEHKLASKQLIKAKTFLDKLISIAAGQKDYLAENAAGQEEKIALLEDEISKLMSNIDTTFFIWELDNFKDNLQTALSQYQPVREQIKRIKDLKKKAESGDDSARVELGRLFFDKGYLGKSETYLAAIVNEEIKKGVSIYLEIFKVEKEIQKPENLTYKKTPGDYDTMMLAGLKILIEGYLANLEGDKEVLAALKEVKKKTSSGAAIDLNELGEIKESVVLGKEDKKKLEDYFSRILQAAGAEIESQEPEILKKRAGLYETLGKSVPEKK